VKGSAQGVMHCPCGNAKIHARGMCATCYALRRQDQKHFGGLREAVLERDDYRCRVCDASGRDKRSIIVHHRVPERSKLNSMLSLCPACHAKVHRTNAVLSLMPPLLLELWREQHPKGHEQIQLDFRSKRQPARPLPLFEINGRRSEHDSCR
jgi:5-methylcytosine-specific restriction endonuclease McrA